MFDKQDDSGVSPVIGVILMVAVTVALVALVTVTVFDLGGDVSESPDATVQLEQTDSDIQATLLRNENVDELYLQNARAGFNTKDSGTEAVMVNAGDTVSFAADTADGEFADNGSAWQDGDTVNVIAVIGGESEVLTSTEYNA